MLPVPDPARPAIALAVLFLAAATAGVAGTTAVSTPGDGPATRGPANATNATNAANATNATVAVERIDGTELPPDGDDWPAATPGTADSTGGIAVVIEADHSGAVNASRLRESGATVDGRRGALVEATVPPARVPAVRALPWVDRVRTPVSARSLELSRGVADVGADAVHGSGVTGENVSVGIIDTGFDPDHPEVDPNVADTAAFSEGGIGGTSGTAADHGTAVAELLVDTAPDADLYLASIDTDVDFLKAVDWLESREVDVVVTSLGFYAQPYDGDGRIAERADRAVANGTAFLNAAGNDGRDHWEGRFADPDGDGVHNFAGEDEGTTLNAGSELRAGSRVTVTLQWDEWPTADHDYDLLLMRERTGENTVVARSTRVNGRSVPAERLRTTVPKDGRYSVAIRADDPSATAAPELFFLDRRRYDRAEPEYVNASSSIIAPATGDRVVAIGAYDVRDGQFAPYSARGPTDDGDRGVDVGAPSSVDTATYDGPFAGTSAAAPHAAGVAALAWAGTAEPDAGSVAAAVRASADDEGSAGPDTAWGTGRLNATATVAAGTDGGDGTDPLPAVGDSDAPPADPDDDGRYEDVDGNGRVDIVDVSVLLGALDDEAVRDHVAAYDFDGNDEVTIIDVAELLAGV